MPTEVRLETNILPGHRLEVSAPELPEGAKVEVKDAWDRWRMPRDGKE